MKIIRTSKCSIKFATNKKRQELQTVLKEYGKVVNVFIDYFWDKKLDKRDLLKPIYNIPSTWLGATLRQRAAMESLDMIGSVKEAFEWNKQQIQDNISVLERKIKNTDTVTRLNRKKINNWHKKVKALNMKLPMIQMHKPKHRGNRMSVSSTIGELQTSEETANFNAWLHLQSMGNKVNIYLPIKFHKQYKKLNAIGQRLNSYIITKDYVQFAFKIETGPKNEVKNIIGVDTGINAMASTSEGKQFGRDIKERINKIKRCKSGSNGKKRAIRALKQRIDEVSKEALKDVDLVVVEKLNNLNSNSKLKGRLSRNMRSSIGSWNYAYWLMRIEQWCERNRVSFRTVTPYNTSRHCPSCSHTDSRNRVGEIFKCQACGYSGNADIVAALNIRERFLTGKYGSCYKPENKQELPTSGFL
jgi:IS605 OrfB family transposase